MIRREPRGRIHPSVCHHAGVMPRYRGQPPSKAHPKSATLGAAIGAYADAMEGTGVDLDEDFEAAALEAWADLDDCDSDRARRGEDR